MESNIAKEAEQALVEATQRLNPEERLNAFLAHCRLIMELYEAGQEARRSACATAAMRTTRSGESALLLLDVIDLLSGQNIEYAVVGVGCVSLWCRAGKHGCRCGVVCGCATSRGHRAEAQSGRNSN